MDVLDSFKIHYDYAIRADHKIMDCPTDMGGRIITEITRLREENKRFKDFYLLARAADPDPVEINVPELVYKITSWVIEHAFGPLSQDELGTLHWIRIAASQAMFNEGGQGGEQECTQD